MENKKDISIQEIRDREKNKLIEKYDDKFIEVKDNIDPVIDQISKFLEFMKDDEINLIDFVDSKNNETYPDSYSDINDKLKQIQIALPNIYEFAEKEHDREEENVKISNQTKNNLYRVCLISFIVHIICLFLVYRYWMLLLYDIFKIITNKAVVSNQRCERVFQFYIFYSQLTHFQFHGCILC